MAGSIIDDGLRETRPDADDEIEVVHRGQVNVDFEAVNQPRPCPHSAVGHASCAVQANPLAASQLSTGPEIDIDGAADASTRSVVYLHKLRTRGLHRSYAGIE